MEYSYLNLDDAPQITPEICNSNLNYCCSECSSLIEILSINEKTNIIEFKCLNKENNHGIKVMQISDFLSKMEKYKKNEINRDSCKEHSSNIDNNYIDFCFDCNRHLCKYCLKTRTHINHFKNNIIEIQPIKEELNIIDGIIKDYNIKIENLKNEKIKMQKELNNRLNIKIRDENESIKEKTRINNENKEKETKSLYQSYLLDIKDIKNKYENEIKIRKNKYERDFIETMNKYNLISQKYYIIHEYKLKELNREYTDKLNNLKYDNKIENIMYIKKINEIIFNAYNKYSNNFYNSLNINNILLSYIDNDYVKNNLMKKILNNNYEAILKIILAKKNEDIKCNLIKGKKFEEIDQIKEENKKMKKMIEEKDKELSQYKIIKKQFEPKKIFKENKVNLIKKKIYSYECLNINNLSTCISPYTKETKIEIILKNNGNQIWPEGNTKLKFDKTSDIIGNEIILEPQAPGEQKSYDIFFNKIDNYFSGEYKSNLWFCINDLNYGENLKIRLKFEIKREVQKNIKEFRNLFGLSEEEYSDKEIYESLIKNNFDYNSTFASLF